jgi:hypothetical protein
MSASRNQAAIRQKGHICAASEKFWENWRIAVIQCECERSLSPKRKRTFWEKVISNYATDFLSDLSATEPAQDAKFRFIGNRPYVCPTFLRISPAPERLHKDHCAMINWGRE